MNQKSCLGEFAKYVSSNVLGMIGLSCYILADTFFIAKGMGADGLTALNLAIPVYSFIHGTGLLLGVGGATRYSILRGGGGKKAADAVFTATVYAAIVIAVLFVAVGLFGSGVITALLGAEGAVFEMTHIYLKVILLFSPAFIMNNVFINFVRNDGNPRLSMIAMLAGSFSNIILDYIFIFPFGMGIFGAVLATGFSPVISMIILSAHKKREEHFLLLKREDMRDLKAAGGAGVPEMVGRIAQLGAPSLITEVASGIVMIVFNFVILDLRGNVGVAAYGVVANLALVVTAIFNGIAQGMQPLVSRAYGVGDKKTMKQILRYAMLVMVVISVVIFAAFYVYAEPIARIFNSENNAELQSMAVDGLKLYFTSNLFVGFNIILAMFFTASERPAPAQVISVLRGMVLVIPMTFLMAAVAGLTGVWLTILVTEAVVAVVGGILYGLS